MTTVLLVRHGLTAANASGVLAGWTPGIGLSDKGREQVAALASRLAPVPLAAVVSSPLQRCRETAAALVMDRSIAVEEDSDVRATLGSSIAPARRWRPAGA